MANTPLTPLLGQQLRERLGPAMMKLSTERRREFVRQFVALGQRNAKQAYIRAGFKATTENSAAVNGCNLLHNADIQDAIKEYSLQALVALAPVATRVAGDLLESAQTDAAVRAGLVKAIWDRTGMVATTEHKVTVEHIGNDPRMLAEARQVVAQLGLNKEQIEQFLGRSIAEKIVDVEYQDITEDDEPEEVPQIEELLL